MPKKAYVHFEQSGAVFTIAVPIDESSSVTSILEKFAVALSKAHGRSYDGSMFELKNADKKLLSERKKYDFLELIEESNDFYVSDPAGNVRLSAPAAPGASPIAAKPAAGVEPVVTISENDIKENKDKVKELLEKRHYKKARVICEQMGKEVLPKAEVYFISSLANIYFATKNYSKCIQMCRKALAANPLQLDNKFLLAKAFFADKQYSEARDELEELKNIVPASVTKKAKFPLKNGGGTAVISCSYVDILALEAESVFEDGDHNAGANLINAAMGYPKADANLGVLLAYATFSLRYNKTEEAVRSLLKAITVSQSDKRVRFLLSEVLKHSQGLAELKSQLPVSDQSASAYAFLGTVVKDYSAINSSIELYRMALQGQPTSSSYALNVMHSIEITYRLDEVVSEFMAFARKVPTFTKANRLYPLLQSVLKILEEKLPLHTPSTSDALSSGMTMTWVVDKRNDFNSHARVRPLNEPSTMDIDDEDGAAAEENVIDLKKITKHRFNDQELEVLSMCYTLVKVLYQQGKLYILPHLFKVIEYQRVQSVQPLHETQMRNENAYYQSISQIMCYNRAAPDQPHHIANPAKAALTGTLGHEKPIYVCGDSHTLSPAWSKITVKGKERLLVPKLVTGVKQWHLRSEGNFYPKANFQYAMESIPDGSEVILIIGEIDCREGMLVACERDYYESLPQAMEHTVSLFVKDVLKNLVNRKKLKLYIHPIVSVIDATRHLAIPYNNIFKNACQNIPGVSWLDLFENLLSYTGPTPLLRDRYKMDGTHLSPAYVELIEQAFNQL